MKSFVLNLLSVAGLALALLVPGMATAERVALVIGSDAYANLPRLQKAGNDADAVAQTLTEIGFEVALLKDADRRMMTRALSDLAIRTGPESEVMFYFAGHGVELSGRNYLLPTDAPAAAPGDEAFLAAESLAVDQVLETLQSRGARVTVLILDACRDNPFPKTGTRSAGGNRGLAAVTAPEGAFILFSAGTGQSAIDSMGAGDDNPNSVFTRTLLPLLREADRPFQEIARAVRGDVEALAARVNHKQRPAYYDELTGDFILTDATLRGAAPLGTPPPIAADDDACTAAARDWANIEKFGDAALFRSFAETHSACALFSRAALERAEELDKVKAPSSSISITVPSFSPPVATWRIKRDVSGGYMNVRDGRGTDYPVLFQLASGLGGIKVLECAPPQSGAVPRTGA